MKVLVACERSQRVAMAFRARGHEAFSCDTSEATGGHPEFHIRGDALATMGRGWDLLIAHPPCTHLASSGARWMKGKGPAVLDAAALFFLDLARAPVARICIENPIGIMSTRFRKPDQIVQPWQFGESFQKSTCLWLKGPPPLQATKIVSRGAFVTTPGGSRLPAWYSNQTKSQRQRNRSVTFQGIADAMAEQWG